jgi:hypothetical protein
LELKTAIAESLVTGKALAGTDEDMAAATAKSEAEAHVQALFSQSVRHAGALTRARFDYIAGLTGTIERIQMEDDGMCAIRAVMTAVGQGILFDGQFKDLLAQLRSNLLALTEGQKRYVHQVNELWDPTTEYCSGGSNYRVDFSLPQFDTYVREIGAWDPAKKKYDTHLEAGTAMFLARMFGVCNTQIYLEGAGDTFLVHTYGDMDLHFNLDKPTTVTATVGLAYMSIGFGHYDLVRTLVPDTVLAQSTTYTPPEPSQSSAPSQPDSEASALPNASQDVDVSNDADALLLSQLCAPSSSQTDSEASTLRNTSQVSVLPQVSVLLVTIQGVCGPYPYSLRPDWLSLSPLTSEEKNAVSAAQSNKSYATALPMQPGKLANGQPGKLNGNLTFQQLQCLKPNTWLNEAVINVVDGLLQWQTKDVLVLSTFTWTKYQQCSRGTLGGKLKLRRSIVKHMKLYEVRSAVVSPFV